MIGICKTWLNNTHDDNLVNFDNFTLFIVDREFGNIRNVNQRSKRGGGLIVYVGSKFKGHVNQIDTCIKISDI